MEKTLLYEAFVSLTATEIRELGKFVRSPFFNTKPQLIALYDYLTDCRSRTVLPEAEKAFEALYPGQPYDDQKMRLANSALLALLEHFWVYQEKFQEADVAKTQLAAAYRKRNLGKHFQIALREARQAHEQQPFRHAEHYHDLQRLEWEQYQFVTATKRTELFNLQENSDLMDVAYLARKLQLACLAVAHQAVFQSHYQLGLLEEILAHVVQPPLMDLPVISLYYHCYKFSTDRAVATEHFTRFREILAISSDAFPAEELRTLHLLAINFGVKKINESQGDWLTATLSLYQSALERGLLLENGVLSRFAFNNIVAIALRVGEASWAESFIHQHKSSLERQYREATASFNLARVAYDRRDYPTALANLQRSDYKDLINNLTAKALQLKVYYEIRAYDLLDSHLVSMKNYIRRHTAIGYHRTNYSRMVHYTQALMALNFNDRVAVETLRARILAEPVLTEKDWLLAMMNDK